MLLNLLWAGLGQIYLGQWKCGLALVFCNILAFTMTVGLGYFVMVASAIYYAVRDAGRLERGEPIDQWVRLPVRRPGR